MRQNRNVLLAVSVALVLGLMLAGCVGKNSSSESKAAVARDEKRYTVSAEGVITDSKTGLEWVVGPSAPTSYNQAEAWVKGCKIAGGGWRMPMLHELNGLYEKGVGEFNLSPVFKVKGKQVVLLGSTVNVLTVCAAAPNGGKSSSAWGFDFFVYGVGNIDWDNRDDDYHGSGRAFGVRGSKGDR
jgi:hypothetical protein